MSNKRATTVACLAVLATVAALPVAAVAPRRTRLVGEAILQHALRFEGRTVGGLSGVDYDPRTGRWVLISDHTLQPGTERPDGHRRRALTPGAGLDLR